MEYHALRSLAKLINSLSHISKATTCLQLLKLVFSDFNHKYPSSWVRRWAGFALTVVYWAESRSSVPWTYFPLKVFCTKTKPENDPRDGWWRFAASEAHFYNS